MPKSSHHAPRDKDMKKEPMMTPKEKKMAKRAKKEKEQDGEKGRTRRSIGWVVAAISALAVGAWQMTRRRTARPA